MKASSLLALHEFIAQHPLAWNTFLKTSATAILKDFEFRQDRGAFVLTDGTKAEHAFRLYRENIVALASPNGNFVFIDGNPVLI